MRIYYTKLKKVIICALFTLLSIYPLIAQTKDIAVAIPVSKLTEKALFTKQQSDSNIDINTIINDAVALAVRQEEQYVLLALKTNLATYNEEIKNVQKQKTLWIKVCAVQTAIIATGIVVGVIKLSKGR